MPSSAMKSWLNIPDFIDGWDKFVFLDNTLNLLLKCLISSKNSVLPKWSDCWVHVLSSRQSTAASCSEMFSFLSH